MSYENTSCPCGGRKERETMICADCVTAINAANPNDLALCDEDGAGVIHWLGVVAHVAFFSFGSNGTRRPAAS